VPSAPDVGVYLLAKPPPSSPWPSVWIAWPDFRLPTDRTAALASLADAFDRGIDHHVEFACAGGRGRTGCAMAVLAVLAGVDADDAVDWVRAAYHPRAVETPWQRRWIRRLDTDRIREAQPSSRPEHPIDG
jgi:protein-tyrosine phosphatase